MGKNLDENDKYLLGYIYGLCDYTNDLHGLDNEIQGIGTIMQMHTFFFGDRDPSDLGSIFGKTAKLSSAGEKNFLSGAVHGGSAISNEKILSQSPHEAYQKLLEHFKKI